MARDPFPSETQDRFLLRMPDGMRDRLKALAEQNKRSMNAEIIARLEGSIRAQEDELKRFQEAKQETLAPRSVAPYSERKMTTEAMLDIKDEIANLRHMLETIITAEKARRE